MKWSLVASGGCVCGLKKCSSCSDSIRSWDWYQYITHLGTTIARLVVLAPAAERKWVKNESAHVSACLSQNIICNIAHIIFSVWRTPSFLNDFTLNSGVHCG